MCVITAVREEEGRWEGEQTEVSRCPAATWRACACSAPAGSARTWAGRRGPGLGAAPLGYRKLQVGCCLSRWHVWLTPAQVLGLEARRPGNGQNPTLQPEGLPSILRAEK